jgi:hypothetical protein
MFARGRQRDGFRHKLPHVSRLTMSSTLIPTRSQRDQALFLNEHLPAGLFGGVGADVSRVAWRLSPQAFPLSPQTFSAIDRLGSDLLRFYQALNALYTRSARGTAPGFIAEYLDRGKPEAIVKLARQNRFRSDLPGVIRPDLILTETGFIITELDNVPGGMGFTGAMAQAYAELGQQTIGDVDGIPDALSAMLVSVAGKEKPVTAIVVSEESKDYRSEMEWIAQAITKRGHGTAYACKPEDIMFTEDALFVRLSDDRVEKIDVLYRNFELFDFLNIAKQELMFYAARHHRVKMTPPPKAQLEEKLAFALLHHPALAKFWRAELGDVYERLRAIFPQTWVLDPRPLPPQGFIHGLHAAGEPVQNFLQLAVLGKSERDYVVKASGFSESAWGSRSVKVANDLTKDAWENALVKALGSFDTTPYVLQRFHKGKRVRIPYYDAKSDDIQILDGRVRLSPYYFVVDGGVRLGGILATVAGADKKLIHGMTDAIMAPCVLDEAGY